MYTESESQTKQRSTSFVYHAPKDNQPERYVRLREAANQMALLMNTNCPPSRELSLAITNLEQSVMWANKAIACNE